MADRATGASLLRNSDFLCLWFGQTVSTLGDFFMILAFPVMTYNLTGSKVALSIVLALESIPVICLGPVAGAVVDRWNKRRTMLTADILQALILVPLLVTRGRQLLVSIYAVSFLLSLFGTFFSPALNSALPRITGQENLLRANSLRSATTSAVQVLAPALGAAVYTLFGHKTVVLVDLASFLFSAGCVALLRTPLDPAGPGEPVSLRKVRQDIVTGGRYIRGARTLLVPFTVFLFFGLKQGFTGTLVFPYMKDILHTGEQGFGLAMSVQGLGNIAGSLALAAVGSRLDRTRTFVFTALAAAVLSIPLWNVNRFPPFLTLIAVTGFFISAAIAVLNTFIQSADATFVGRVANTFYAVFRLGIVSTTGVAGFLADAWGTRAALNLGVGLGVVGAAAGLSLLRAGFRAERGNTTGAATAGATPGNSLP